jgi:SAM-dependent methyltransferase
LHPQVTSYTKYRSRSDRFPRWSDSPIGMSNALVKLVERSRERFQEQRADLFLELMQPGPGLRILDLGGNRGQFAERLRLRADLDITVADIIDFSTECAARGFHFIQLQDGARLPIDDAAFDIVFCNSVIEHVTLPKQQCAELRLPESAWARAALQAQKTFAQEVRRIGRGYFVQTPHRDFPLDLHLWLPLTNWLPHAALQRLVPVTDRYWIKWSGVPDWHLLGPAQMQAFFPQASIWIERFAGLPKSIIAYERPP